MKILFKKPLQLFAFGVSLSLMTTTARSETLADALVSAYNHSGLLEQNRALLRAADEDVASASAALLPIVNWSSQNTERTLQQLKTYPAGSECNDRLSTPSFCSMILVGQRPLLQLHVKVYLPHVLSCYRPSSR